MLPSIKITSVSSTQVSDTREKKLDRWMILSNAGKKYNSAGILLDRLKNRKVVKARSS